MKKVILSALLATTFFGFTSCSDNEDPILEPSIVSTGVFVLNEGNSYSGINGSLTSYDYVGNTATQNAYKAVNGTELGGTPNDAIVYGSKLYICSSDESMVFVANNLSLKEEKKIEVRKVGLAYWTENFEDALMTGWGLSQVPHAASIVDNTSVSVKLGSKDLHMDKGGSYVITPTFTDGVSEITFWQCRSESETLTIYTSTDYGTTWTKFTDVVASSSAMAKVYINDSKVTRIKIANESGGDADIDDITVYSVSHKIMPREFLAAGGKVYVSTYGNEVLVIDTLSLSVTGHYACGANAEGMAISADGKTLYVANSDGYTAKGSISAINLTDGTTTTISNSGIKNPTRIFVVNGQVYFLDMGSYDPITYVQSGEGLYRLTDTGSVKLAEASEVKYFAGKFYMYHARYGETATYSVYDLSTGKESTFIDGTDIAAPATIGIDPILGCVVITSYSTANGYADYSADGYAVVYDAAGVKQARFETGVGPTTIVFNSAKVTHIAN